MDLSGLSMEELQERLAAADGYDERAAIRAELRRLKKEQGAQSAAPTSRRSAGTYNRFGGSSDVLRVRAATISVTSTSRPKGSKQGQAKDDSAVKLATSSRNDDSNPASVLSPEPNVNHAPPTHIKSPPPTSNTADDEPDVGVKKTNQKMAADKHQSTKPPEEKAEFQGFKLRKTGLSVKDKGRSSTAANKNKPITTSEYALHSSTSSSTAKSSTRSAKSYSPARNATKPDHVSSKQSGDAPADQLQQYLVAYVNQSLSLDPPLPSAGRPFYSTCSQPDIICSLLNHAVPDTVDMRALSPNQEPDSKEANMMLALESARAIGCHISDDSSQHIDKGEPQAIRQLIMDIVRAQVVHLPNMEDEPRETFEDPAKLFALIGICIGNSKQELTPEPFSPPPKSTPSPKDTPPPSSAASNLDGSLSYEERVALRRAEREERRRLREALS